MGQCSFAVIFAQPPRHCGLGQAGPVGNVPNGTTLPTKGCQRARIVAGFDGAYFPMIADKTNLEWLGVGAMEATVFLKMELKAGTLVGRIVGRPTQSNNRVENIFLFGRSPLGTGFSTMMDQNYRLSSTS